MYGKMKDHLSKTLAEIKEAGLYKEERLIESAQQAASSSLWMSCVPQMKRTDDMPYPRRSIICWAAAISRGWLDSPR